MRNTIQKRPFIISKDNYTKLERLSLTQGEFQEEWLQNLLQRSPQLLPAAEIDTIYAPLICIGREVSTAVGNIDNLYISPKGYITIVETKLWRNPQARREVVGQIIDYAKELKNFSYEELDEKVIMYNIKYFGIKRNLFETMKYHKMLEEEDESLFVDLVQKNLSNARFLLMIVGDGIRDSVWRMSEFLNSTPNMLYNLALVELEVYRMIDDTKLVVPNLLMKTQTVERGVFRFEKGELITVENTDLEDRSDSKRIKEMSSEEFAKLVVTKNPLIIEDNMIKLLEDIADLGFVINPYRKTDLRVKYPMPGGQGYLNVIYFSAKYNGVAYKNSGTLERDLIRKGYSGEIANKFYKELDRFLLNGECMKDSICHDLKSITNDKDEFIAILDKLISNF